MVVLLTLGEESEPRYTDTWSTYAEHGRFDPDHAAHSYTRSQTHSHTIESQTPPPYNSSVQALNCYPYVHLKSRDISSDLTETKHSSRNRKTFGSE